MGSAAGWKRRCPARRRPLVADQRGLEHAGALGKDGDLPVHRLAVGQTAHQLHPLADRVRRGAFDLQRQRRACDVAARLLAAAARNSPRAVATNDGSSTSACAKRPRGVTRRAGHQHQLHLGSPPSEPGAIGWSGLQGNSAVAPLPSGRTSRQSSAGRNPRRSSTAHGSQNHSALIVGGLSSRARVTNSRRGPAATARPRGRGVDAGRVRVDHRAPNNYNAREHAAAAVSRHARRRSARRRQERLPWTYLTCTRLAARLPDQQPRAERQRFGRRPPRRVRRMARAGCAAGA